MAKGARLSTTGALVRTGVGTLICLYCRLGLLRWIGDPNELLCPHPSNHGLPPSLIQGGQLPLPSWDRSFPTKPQLGSEAKKPGTGVRGKTYVNM